jgi:hypothetical protein
LLVLILGLLAFTPASHGQKDPNLRIETVVNGYTVRHVVFNSTFVLPEVAKIYGVKRSKFESLLNVSVNPKGELGSMPAEVTGTITNMMQQQKILEFKEIKEKDATYYLAPIRINNEELLHFDLSVTPAGGEALRVKFSQTVYADE